MILENKDLKKLFHGAVAYKKTKGYIRPRRFLDEQVAIFNDHTVPNYRFYQERTYCGASITIELATNATKIAFDYKFFFKTGVKSTFEVYVDGFLTHLVHDAELQEGKLEFTFKKGDKHIEIYIPNYSEVGIKNFEIDGEYKPVAKNKTKVLFIGDSITQGGGTERSGVTYVNVVKRAMRYEIVNLGIGGHVCEKDLLVQTSFRPDKIVVAYGTNHRRRSDEENVRRITEFFEKLNSLYGNLPVLVIMPPYAGDLDPDFLRTAFTKIKQLFEMMLAKYPNIKMVSAYDMVPHFPEYYMADMVHPNAFGAEVYGNNLVKAIKQLKF